MQVTIFRLFNQHFCGFDVVKGRDLSPVVLAHHHVQITGVTGLDLSLQSYNLLKKAINLPSKSVTSTRNKQSKPNI
jgi:hypothetical protein